MSQEYDVSKGSGSRRDSCKGRQSKEIEFEEVTTNDETKPSLRNTVKKRYSAFYNYTKELEVNRDRENKSEDIGNIGITDEKNIRLSKSDDVIKEEASSNKVKNDIFNQEESLDNTPKAENLPCYETPKFEIQEENSPQDKESNHSENQVDKESIGFDTPKMSDTKSKRSYLSLKSIGKSFKNLKNKLLGSSKKVKK